LLRASGEPSNVRVEVSKHERNIYLNKDNKDKEVPMKVLMTTHQFLPEYGYGTEIITHGIAKELQSRGHEVTIITGHDVKTPLADSERFDRYFHDGLKVERFLHDCVPMGGQDDIVEAQYNNRLFYSWFKTYLEKTRPHIVHFMHLSRLSASAVDPCTELGIPTVFTSTDFWLVCPGNLLFLPDQTPCNGPNAHGTNCLRHAIAFSEPSAIRLVFDLLPERLLASMVRLCKKWARPGYPLKLRAVRSLALRQDFIRQRMDRVDRIIVPSRIMGDLFAANMHDSARIIHLPYGINTAHITRRTDKGRHPKLRIGFIGRIHEPKGAHVLVQAIKNLDPALPVELKIHGRTDDYPAYVDKLHRLIRKDKRISLAGPFANDKVDVILESMDVLVCPSIWYENTPLVIYEAMAAGCPVIASNLRGMAESIDPGVNGLLFEPGNSVQLAGLLAQIEADRDQVARLAAMTKPPLSVSDHVSALEEIYRQVLSCPLKSRTRET
jgi:glycosyltransferase involved in cell wall biosynthesis